MRPSITEPRAHLLFCRRLSGGGGALHQCHTRIPQRASRPRPGLRRSLHHCADLLGALSGAHVALAGTPKQLPVSSMPFGDALIASLVGKRASGSSATRPSPLRLLRHGVQADADREDIVKAKCQRNLLTIWEICSSGRALALMGISVRLHCYSGVARHEGHSRP